MSLRTVVQVLDFVPNQFRSMELFLLAFAAELRRRGWRTVFVFAGEPGAEFREQLAQLDAPYLTGKFQFSWREARDLGRRLRAYRPEVIQTHFLGKFVPGQLAMKRAAGARWLVVTDHSSGVGLPKSLPVRLLSRVRGWLVGRYIDRLVTVSEFIGRRDAEDVHFPADQIRVVYNGVDTRRFAPVERNPNPAFTIAYAGRLTPGKGVLTLLRAVQALTAAGRDVRLRVAGRGEQADELKQFAAAVGLGDRVTFLGQIDWMPRLFGSADAVVVPSEVDEAFGFTAAEAAACGACVVVADSGALPEIVGRDNTAGLVYPKGDPDALAAALGELMDDPARRERIRQAARARAVGMFNIERMVEGHCRYYDELGGPPPPAARRPAAAQPAGV